MTVESPFAAQLNDIPVEKREVVVLGSTTRYWVYGDPNAATTVVVVPRVPRRAPRTGAGDRSAAAHPVHQSRPARLRRVHPAGGHGPRHQRVRRLAHRVRRRGRRASTLLILGHSFGTIVSCGRTGRRSEDPRADPDQSDRDLRAEGTAPDRDADHRGVLPACRRCCRTQIGFALLKNWLIVQFMSSSLAKTKDKARRKWIHAEHHTYFNRFASRDVVVEAFLASISTDVSAFASRIEVPTLLVAAELDDITPVAAQHDLQASVPARDAAGAARGRAPHPLRGACGRRERHHRVHRVIAEALKILFDCRYTRFDRHDGISRYTTGLVTALAQLHPVTMLISDERQLAMLPDLPWILGSGVTSVNEPWIARTVNRVEPDVVFSPMQTMGSLGRRYRLILTLHDLIYYTHRTPPREFSLADQAAVARLPPRLLAAADRAGARRRHRDRLRDGTHGRSLSTGWPAGRSPWCGTRSSQQERVRRTAPQQRNLVYMGSFMPYKRVETLLAAMHLLPGYRLHLLSSISAREQDAAVGSCAGGRRGLRGRRQ